MYPMQLVIFMCKEFGMNGYVCMIYQVTWNHVQHMHVDASLPELPAREH